MLIEEYKRSLKMPEAEEIFDLIFYRPLGFLFVKAIYRSPITPNQITILSMIAGLASAYCLLIGTRQFLLYAGLLYMIANILDCSDGQLARLQRSGTPLGRLVDGIADYISSITIFLAIGFGLSASGIGDWGLVVFAGISSAVHAMLFDYYQSEYISTVRGERNFLESEVMKFTEEIRKRKSERRNAVKTIMLEMYLRYLHVQKRSNTKQEGRSFKPEQYRNKNRLMIRFWSFLGPTTNRTILIACALAGRIDLFLWVIITFGNVLLLCCYVVQQKIHQSMSVQK